MASPSGLQLSGPLSCRSSIVSPRGVGPLHPGFLAALWCWEEVENWALRNEAWGLRRKVLKQSVTRSISESAKKPLLSYSPMQGPVLGTVGKRGNPIPTSQSLHFMRRWAQPTGI